MFQKKNNELKIAVCGGGGVGKTTLLKSFKKGHFVGDVSITTEVEYHIVHLNLIKEKEHLFLVFWDFGGQRQFQDMEIKDITKFIEHAQQADAIMLCFDLNDLDTLEEVSEWVKLLPVDIPRILVGTKKDLGGSMADLIELYLETFKFQSYIETSAKTDITSVNRVFEELLIVMLAFKREKAHRIIQNYNNSLSLLWRA
ncbi:MAG: GTP-binding protein [Candidatus Hermodarchaeota archaeon]